MPRRLNTPLSDEPPPSHIPTMPVIPDDLDAEAMARRKLLKLAAYTAPLVIGTLIAGPADAASKDDEWCDDKDGISSHCR